MASFDLDEPSDDVDTEFARKLIRSGSRDRSEMPTLYVDEDHSEAELLQVSELIGQPVQRRPR
jgi:hypothetical protein